MGKDSIEIARRVVITGLGCVSPNGIGKEAFFDSLIAGRSGVKRITRFDTSPFPVHIAGEIPEFKEEDFLSKKELRHTGRAVPMALCAAGEALQDAGLRPARLSRESKRRMGVILGSGGGAMDFAEKEFQKYFSGQTKKTSAYGIPSATTGSLSSEISLAFGLRGPSHVISTGCTSSSDAMGYAMREIQSGRADLMLSGGSDCVIRPGILSSFCLMKVLTAAWNEDPERASRPFSLDRDGFVLGEGAWTFVLESETGARSRGAVPYAELAGYASTCDAYHRVRPEASGEESARAMTLALHEAKVSPSELDYVNLHGTSTKLNDRIETLAAKSALGENATRIPMSSVKSMIGHPQGASGAAGVAAALCAMERGFIPPTLNLETPDPECDLDYTPHRARRASVQTALCNCLGFGSKNSALVLRKTAQDAKT